MKKCAGIWLDHRHAIIVKLREEGKTPVGITSYIYCNEAENSGEDHSPFSRNKNIPEKRLSNKWHQQLQRYYSNIFDEIKNENTIVILGPGMARHELQSELQKDGRGTYHILHNMATDKMNVAAIIAKVSNLFN